MRKISLFALLLGVSVVSVANAATKTDGEQYATPWGITEQTTCGGTGEEAGWGEFKGYNASKFAKNMMKNRADDTDLGWGAVYYVAREMNDKGYKFCKTVVAADRDGGCTKKPYTTYYDVATEQDCFWLCSDGFFGDECSQPSFAGDDTVTQVHTARNKIANGKVASLSSIKNIIGSDKTNIKDEIPMLKSDVEVDCSKLDRVDLSSNKKQEHNTVLAIKSVVVDGSNVTYTIQPLAVRAGGYAGCLWGGDDAAWPMVAWVGNSDSTYCPSTGYMHKDGGGCFVPAADGTAAPEEVAEYAAAVAKAKTAEEQGLSILCTGYDKTKYNNAYHQLTKNDFSYYDWTEKMDQSGECAKFICKNGMGYISDPVTSGDFSCHNCKVSKDASIHPSRLGLGSDGICKVCEVGKVYNADTKDCANAKGIHKFKMAGISNPDQDIKDQCWTMSGPDEYKQCMKGYINSTTEINDN